jgi:Na+-driven multidrug efflux pump
MGAQGAALGTVFAEALIPGWFVWGFLRGRLPVVGTFPVELSPTRPYVDLPLTRQLLVITGPIIVQKLGRAFARFPLFAILALLGPTVVAAFEVGRRIRGLMGASGSGFSMAASGVVGQELGRHDESNAGRYAMDVIWFSATVYVASALLVFLFARPLAFFFTEDPSLISRTVPFIQIAAISYFGLGMSKTFGGILRAAGDNQWIMYGQLISQYGVLIPLTYLGTITPLGVLAVYLAIVAEIVVRAAVIGHRFVSGNWKIVSRAYRPGAADD